MRIATIQMKMKWRCKANVETILLTNAYVAKFGVDVVIYPELSVTGYHREVREETDEVLLNPTLLSDISASARAHKLFVWVGVPKRTGVGIHNTYQCYGSNGDLLGEIYKNGLTITEEILFSRGRKRPTFQIGAWNVSSFLCRESADLPILIQQFDGNQPDILFWPGYIGNQSANPEGTADQALGISKVLSAYVIQCNWANSLNSPDQKDLGGSIVTDRDGNLIGRCPDAEAGIGIVDLDTDRFYWDTMCF